MMLNIFVEAVIFFSRFFHEQKVKTVFILNIIPFEH